MDNHTSYKQVKREWTTSEHPPRQVKTKWSPTRERKRECVLSCLGTYSRSLPTSSAAHVWSTLVMVWICSNRHFRTVKFIKSAQWNCCVQKWFVHCTEIDVQHYFRKRVTRGVHFYKRIGIIWPLELCRMRFTEKFVTHYSMFKSLETTRHDSCSPICGWCIT